jgi:hypothetical protein
MMRRMDHFEFWTIFVILLWIAYDTREIRKPHVTNRPTVPSLN